jgi:ATP-binding cassette, subfamily G (WHITE), member 2, SNQ2
MYYRETIGPNQACTVFGSAPGSSQIPGRSYLEAAFTLDVADIWRRNFIVLIGFFIFFLFTQVLAIEFFPVCITPSFVR